MKGPVNVVSAWCTAQCAKYFKKYAKTVNSTEAIDSKKDNAFREWMEE